MALTRWAAPQIAVGYHEDRRNGKNKGVKFNHVPNDAIGTPAYTVERWEICHWMNYWAFKRRQANG